MASVNKINPNLNPFMKAPVANPSFSGTGSPVQTVASGKKPTEGLDQLGQFQQQIAAGSVNPNLSQPAPRYDWGGKLNCCA